MSNGGERVDRRKAVDSMTARLVRSGQDPKSARDKAIKAATRNDNQER